jgi:signal transduction histidine kinase
LIGGATIDDKGNTICFVLDISERKQLEKHKDEFIGIASHELKTPVTSIKAYAQVLEKRFTKVGDMASASLLEKMNSQIDRLTNLIGDLLDATRIDGGKLQFRVVRFNFDELIHEVVEEMQRTTGVHMLRIRGRTGKHVVADRERTGQVVTNFLSNAIKYSPKGREIRIHLRIIKNGVKVCVQDFGVGIPKERQKKVFERFYRVSGPGQETIPGLGLGLFISSEIVKRQGGKIWVDSEEGRGSMFCFTLPLKLRKTQG